MNYRAAKKYPGAGGARPLINRAGLFVILWTGLFALLWAPPKTDSEEKIHPSPIEKLKADITAKNIFCPGKTSPLSSTPDPVETTIIDMTPKWLKKPFTVLGFRITEGQRWVDLAFKDPDRVDKFTIGDVIENIITILDIEPTYMRCEYVGREVRIGQGETSDDALARLLGKMSSDYVLLGTGPAPSGTGYVAYILIRGKEKYLVFEEGETLGQAKIIKIEPGKVRLLDHDGAEVNLTIE